MGLSAPWCDRLEPSHFFLVKFFHAPPTGRQSLVLTFQSVVSEWCVQRVVAVRTR